MDVAGSGCPSHWLRSTLSPTGNGSGSGSSHPTGCRSTRSPASCGAITPAIGACSGRSIWLPAWLLSRSASRRTSFGFAQDVSFDPSALRQAQGAQAQGAQAQGAQAQDAPFGSAQDVPFGSAQDAPFGFAPLDLAPLDYARDRRGRQDRATPTFSTAVAWRSRARWTASRANPAAPEPGSVSCFLFPACPRPFRGFPVCGLQPPATGLPPVISGALPGCPWELARGPEL